MALGILAFLVAVAFWSGVPTPALAPKWAALSAGAPMLLWWARSELKAGHVLGLAFLAWASLSLLWSPILYESAFNYWQLLLVGICFAIGAGTADLRPAYVGFALGMIPSALAAIGQATGVYVVDQMVSPAGLFSNKNFMGEAAAMALVPCLYLAVTERQRRWWLLSISPAVALILSSSRGSIFGVLVAIAMFSWPRARSVSIVVQCFMGACGALMLTVPELSWTFGIRLQIWGDTMQQLTWLGHGIGSFYVVYPEGATQIDTLFNRPEHSHNDFLEILFELGPLGAVLSAAFLAVVFAGRDECARLVLACFVAIGVFGFPLHAAATGLMVGLVAGRLAALGPGLWGWLDAWRGAGRAGLAAARHVPRRVPAPQGGR